MTDLVNSLGTLNSKVNTNTESLTSFDESIPVIISLNDTVTLLEKPTKVILNHIPSNAGVFDNSNFDEVYYDIDFIEDLQRVVPYNNTFIDDLSSTSFTNTTTSTASVSLHRIDANEGDVYESDWVTFDHKTYTKAVFDFTATDNNLHFSTQKSDNFPLTFPITFESTEDLIEISTDGINWIPLDSSLTYIGSFNRLKFRITFGGDNKYILFKDQETKSIKPIYIYFE